MGNVSVRMAVNADLDYLLQRGHINEEVLRRKIGQDEVFLLTVDNQPAGLLILEYLWSIIPYIALIWIEEAHRKQGYSRLLLDFIEVRLRAEGHEVLYSSSQADEAPPQAWHCYMGFTECGLINGINAGGIGEIFFRKTLKDG